MNEYNDPNAFDGIVNHSFATPPQPGPAPTYGDPSPYGPPAAHPTAPAKTGLTRRGKTALTIGVVVLAGCGFTLWQHHADTAATNELKAKELQIQQAQLDLKKQQAAAHANQETQKAQAAAAKTRQKQIDACVQENKGLVGKQLGYRLSNVVEDCQAQYPSTSVSGDDLQTAASASSTNSNTASTGLLIGGGVLVAGMVLVVKRATRPAPQPQPAPYGYYPPR